MALLHRQCDVNSSTSSLRPQHQLISKTSTSLFQSLYHDISNCLRKSEELSNSIDGFCEEYKNKQCEIKRLEQLLSYKKKKQGFKKNQQFQNIQQFKQQKQGYEFTPTVIYQ